MKCDVVEGVECVGVGDGDGGGGSAREIGGDERGRRTISDVDDGVDCVRGVKIW